MKCDNCGRMIKNEEANFCEYCGYSFREHRQAPFHISPREQEVYRDIRMENPNMTTGFPGQTMAPSVNQDKPGSFLSWLGLYGLLLIPFVGWLAFIIIVSLWAFGSNTPTNKKNWARATLVFVGVLIIIFLVMMVVMMISYAPMYQEIYQMINDGTFDYNSYMDLINKYYQ